MEIRVINIGTLAANPMWGERTISPVRTGHATTTLIRAGKRTIIVDPGLPPQTIDARLRERTGAGADAVTHVFLTAFKPDTTRGLRAFDHATWWVGGSERESIGIALATELRNAAATGDPVLLRALGADVAALQRCEPAPDRLADGVDLFPLPGVTPGTCGLILAEPSRTTLVCGDAIATAEHLERGQVLQSVWDLEKARESFTEAVEIADVLVPGRDNVVINPLRRGL